MTLRPESGIVTYMNNTTTHHIAAAALETKGYGIIANIVIEITDFAYTDKYSLGISPEGEEARQEFGGQIISELFGWLVAEPVIVDLNPIADRRPLYFVALGDLIEIEGHGTLRVLPGQGRRPRPTLELVR